MTADRSNYELCFVGGAPRSGTTLLQALISTASTANSVAPECTYFTGLTTAYAQALPKFVAHTAHYFGSISEFRDFNARLLGSVIDHFWASVGNPGILVLKDPALTKLIPQLGGLFPRARFAVAVRDPKDVIASRIAVQKRRHPEAEAAADQIKYYCRQYVDYYEPAITHSVALEGRLAWFRYEEFAAGEKLQLIERFLGEPIRIEKLWRDAQVPLELESEWATPLYGAGLSTSSVQSYRSVLSAEQITLVSQEAGQTYDALNKLLDQRR